MCGCGRKAAVPQMAPVRSAAVTARGLSPAQMAVGQPRVKITYQGPVGAHLVPSPLRRVKSYGLHTRGDIFEVDPADQAARPNLFVLTESS